MDDAVINRNVGKVAAIAERRARRAGDVGGIEAGAARRRDRVGRMYLEIRRRGADRSIDE
jgi:hypothetical protein